MELSDDEVFGNANEGPNAPPSPPSQAGGEMSDADVFGSAPAAQASGEMSDADVFGQQPSASENDLPTPAGSFTRQAIRAAPSGVVGGVAALAAGQAGAELGLAAAPFLGPAAPLGPLLGGAGGALLGGLGGGAVAQVAEDKILALLGMDKTGPLSQPQRALDIQTNPKASFAGELVGGIAPAFGAGGAGTMARVVGAGAQAGMEAGQELYNGDDLSPSKIAMAGAAGAVFARPRGWADRAAQTLRYRGGNKPNEGGQNPDPDVGTSPEPAPEIGDIQIANDLETTAQGTSMTNPPAPEVPGVGNPTGSPMLAREGARPGDPGRDYRKDTTSPLANGETSVVVKNSPVTDEVAQALGQSPEKVQGVTQATQPETGRTSQPGEALTPAPTNPSVEGTTPEFFRYGKATPPESQFVQRLGDQDLVDASQSQRQGMALRGNGELPANAFEPSPPTQSEQPEQTAAPAVASPIKTGLTPEEINASARARTALKKLGYNRVLSYLDTLPPKEAAQKAVQAYNATQSASGEAVGRDTGEIRTESPRQKLATGAMAASKGDAARKQGAMDFVKGVYDEFGPASDKGKAVDVNDPASARTFAKQAWAEIKQRNNGADPLLRSKTQYVPLKMGEGHTDAYQWLRSLKAAAVGRGVKNFLTLHSAENMGALDRQTGQIEAGIAHRPQLPEAAEQAETATAARPVERTTLDMIPRLPEGKDNTYVDAQNDLRGWLNDIPDKDYETLSEHYDIPTEVDEPADPAHLMQDMMNTLKAAGSRKIVPGKRPGVVTDEAELRAKPVEAPQIAATKGRVLDRNSAEFKELAAKYGDVLNTPKDHSTELQQRLENERAGAQDPLDGSWDGYVKKAKDFLANDSGSGKPFNPPRWMRYLPKDPMSPDADEATKEYSQSLGDEMNRYTKGAQGVRSLTRAITQMSPAYAKAAKAVSAYRDAYRWVEDHPSPADDMQIKDDKMFQIVYVTRKLQSEKRSVYAQTRVVDPNNELGLPPEQSMANPVEKNHVARLLANEDTVDAKDVDPFQNTNRSLSTWRGSLQQRDFKALTDGKGMRIVYSPTDKGMRLWWQGRPVDRAVPAGFEGNVGDKVTVNINKKPVTLTVDNATAREVMKNARDEDGKPLQFHENPLLTEANALIQAQDALDTFKLLQSINSNKGFLDNSMAIKNADDLAEARKKGYIQTKLDQFKERGGRPLYMDRRIAEVLDDFRHAGVDDDSLNGLRQLGTRLIKTLFVTNPLVHGLNVSASWGVQRGWDNFTPRGNYWLAKTTFDAMKAVLTQDQSVIKPAMENGLGLLLPGTLNQRLMQGIARRAGSELMSKPPAWWDAMIYPEWHVRASDVGNEMMRYANKITWGMSDVMTLQRYLENMERRKMSGPDAVAEAHEFLPDYRVPTRINEKMFGPSTSRALSTIARERAVSIFGPYHYDLFKQLAGMTRGVVQGNPKAAGQMMALAVGMYLVYPYLLDRGAQNVTGNKYASVGRRGPIALAQAVSDNVGLTRAVNSVIGMISGAKPNPLVNAPNVSTDIWTPTIPMKVAGELLDNKDFAGHPIFMAPRNKTSPAQWGGAAAHVLDWALGTALPPYQIVSSEMKKQGIKSNIAGRLAQEQVGIKDPSPAAIKYALTAGKRAGREAKYRFKHSGPLERLINR